jgi:hypothetical protein
MDLKLIYHAFRDEGVISIDNRGSIMDINYNPNYMKKYLSLNEYAETVDSKKLLTSLDNQKIIYLLNNYLDDYLYGWSLRKKYLYKDPLLSSLEYGNIYYNEIDSFFNKLKFNFMLRSISPVSFV